ncbi:hypothetical protein ACJJIF_02220 [Microbulbifer sp. SSSA002]|uniref:hypothetical protein n=1 Tax=Microbulbifer sp. SSSA002 TaxID=3243376 RepID=UPI004039A9D1
MYTDEDLNFAVDKKIFTAESVASFRAAIASHQHSPTTDEENFRLIGGFNDIFIVFACFLVLFSSLWLLNSLTSSNSLGLLVFTLLSWAIAEFFVRKRRMALPAIVLLLAFVGGAFALTLSLFPKSQSFDFASLSTASAIASIAAYLHWLRFRVPITIAVGTAALIALLASTAMLTLPSSQNWISAILFFLGLLTFVFAMYWDASDTNRTTRRSDTAFWLHLLSAPLMIHPIFSTLGVFDGYKSLFNTAFVLALYLVITLFSLVIDRRALMVSSLVYVLYALANLINIYGSTGYSLALTGVFMGAALLLLSAYWHPARSLLVAKLPTTLRKFVPAGKVT